MASSTKIYVKYNREEGFTPKLWAKNVCWIAMETAMIQWKERNEIMHGGKFKLNDERDILK